MSAEPKTAAAFARRERERAERSGLRLAKGAALFLRAAGFRVEYLDTTTRVVRREHAQEPWKIGPNVTHGRRPRYAYRWQTPRERAALPDLVVVPWHQAWADCLVVAAAELTRGAGSAKARGLLVRRLLDEPEFARAHSAAVLLGGPEAGGEFLRAAARRR